MRCRFGPHSALLALLALAGCGGHAPPALPQDQALATAANSGRQSLSFGRPKQAVEQYRHAFTLALARNDGAAIGDCGYDLAVAQLAAGDATAALVTVDRTRAALAARSLPGFAELDLVQAASLHRIGQDQEADRWAAQAQQTASDTATLARASYLRGLIADANHDATALANALASFGAPKNPTADWQSDHDALSARLELLRGNDREAAVLAQRSAMLRRDQLDYAGMADSLALAGTALQRAGAPRGAADLFLQAGESAAARGDKHNATPWLQQAQLPGADPLTQRTAADTLAALEKLPD